MLGVTQRPVVVDKMIVPPVRGDLKLMSIGFFLDENAPVMWRGPMLHRALEQFLSDVHWGELDTLVVDMPPGTGDVAISLGQLLPRAEVVVVTTPQPAAQQVAVRAAQMAQKTGMRLIGALENMSHLVGTGEELFGSGGGDELAVRSTRRCSAASRSIRGSASRPTRASRSSGQSPRTRPHGRSTRRQRRSPKPPASPAPSRSRSHSRPKDTTGARREETRRRMSTRDEVIETLRGLGYGDNDANTLADHFLDAEARGKRGHGLTRVEWLTTLDDLEPGARPERVLAEPGFERWEGRGALGYLTLAAICRAQLEDPPAHARVDRGRALLPDRNARLLGAKLADGASSRR